MLTHHTSGTSYKTLEHWYNNAKAKKFMNKQGIEYNLADPGLKGFEIHYFAGVNDVIAKVEDARADVAKLQMNNRNNVVMHEYNNFGHETFVWGIG
jgi:hypothetical protein